MNDAFVGLIKGYFPYVIGFVFLLLVLLLLYANATILNRRWIARIMISFIVLFFFSAVAVLLSRRSPLLRPRIAVLPFTSDGAPAEYSRSIPMALTDILDRFKGDRYFVSDFESVSRAVQMDSLRDFDYVRSLARRGGLSYVISGSIDRGEDDWQLFCTVYHVEGGEAVTEPSLNFGEEGIDTVFDALSRAILTALDLRPPLAAHSWAISPALARKCAAANFLVAQRRFDEALATFLGESSAPALAVVAAIYLERGKYRRYQGYPSVEDLYTGHQIAMRALAEDSTMARSYAVLAEFEILRQEWNSAEDHLRAAYALDTADPKTLYLLAQLHHSRYADLGFRNEEELYRRAIACDPFYSDARIALATFYHNAGENSRALAVLDELFAINPLSIEGLMALGKIYIARNELPEILRIFERIFELDPDYADAYYNLGIVYYHLKDYAEAREYFTRAIAVDNHLDSHVYLGLIARATGENERAIAYFRERVHRKRSEDDRYAELARQNLYELIHPEEFK